jgi:hypothetical protein
MLHVKTAQNASIKSLITVANAPKRTQLVRFLAGKIAPLS